MFTPRRVCPACGYPARQYHWRADTRTGKGRLVCGACAEASPRVPSPAHWSAGPLARPQAVAPLRPAPPTVPLVPVYEPPRATGPLVEVPPAWRAPILPTMRGGSRR